MGIKKVILFIALAVPLSVLVSFFNPFSPRALAACAAGEIPDGSNTCLKPAWLTGTVGTAQVPLASGNGMVTATINSPQDLPPLMDKCVGDHMPTRLETYAQNAYSQGDVGWELHDDKKCWWRYWTPSENKPDSTQAAQGVKAYRDQQGKALQNYCTDKSGGSLECNADMEKYLKDCTQNDKITKNEDLATCISEKSNNKYAKDDILKILERDAPNPSAQEKADTKNTCKIDGIGWIVCPVLTFTGMITDGAYGLISQFLSVNTRIIETGSPTQKAWEVFRNIANVAFVIVFMIIILSQVSSIGISNYGIKKMLPRLIVGAILVNASYLLCQLAVDISQILGLGATGLFGSVTAQITSKTPGTTAGANIGWGDIVGLVLAGTVVGGATIYVLLPVLISFLLSAFLAIALIFLILVARQAIIILLVVVSPLAFVAYLLPNTENMFKRWWKLFYSMLILFPMVGLLFGAGALTKTILNNTADTMLQIVAMGAAAIPLFLTPTLLKGALSATGSFGAKMQGWANGAGKMTRSRAQKGFGERTAPFREALDYRTNQRKIRAAKKAGTGRLRSFYGAVGGGGYGDKLNSRATQLEEDEFRKGVEAESATFSAKDHDEILRIARSGKTASGEAVSTERRVAAINYAAKQGSLKDVASMETTSEDDSHILSAVADAMTSKGMQEVAGSEVYAQVRNGTNLAAIQDLIRKRIENGSMTTEGAAGTESRTKLVETAVGSGGAGLSKEGKENLKKVVDNISENESARNKMTESMKESFGRMGASYPTNPPGPTP